jgi:hypothetical protein
MGATEAGAAEADRLVRRGHVVAAVDLLAGIYRTHPEAALARRLVELRHAATSAVEPGSGRTPWPAPYDDPFPNVARRVPEVSAAGLSTDLLGGAVAHHGAVLVRGLFDHEQVTRTIDATDRARAERDRSADEARDPWYRPFPSPDPRDNGLRRMVAEQAERGWPTRRPPPRRSSMISGPPGQSKSSRAISVSARVFRFSSRRCAPRSSWWPAIRTGRFSTPACGP